MHAYCTCCSSRKSSLPGELPAIRRYQSERIRAIHAAARERGVHFFILSGEYGLISPDQPIPDYDHLLVQEEVVAHAEHIARQLAAAGIDTLTYFTHPLASDSQLQPYYHAIRAACQLQRVALECTEIDPLTHQPIGPANPGRPE